VSPLDDYSPPEDEREKPALERDRSGFMRRTDLFYEFDCPECDANNPWDEGFRDGGEVRCHYCGVELRVKLTDEGLPKLRAL